MKILREIIKTILVCLLFLAFLVCLNNIANAGDYDISIETSPTTSTEQIFTIHIDGCDYKKIIKTEDLESDDKMTEHLLIILETRPPCIK